MFAAVIDRASDEMSERLAAATAERGESQLEPGVRAYLEYIRVRRDLWDPVLSSTQHGAVAAAAARLRDRQVDVVADAIRKGYEDLGLDPDQREVEGLAHVVAGSVESVGRWWLRRGDLDLEAVVQFLVASIGPSLASVRGRGRSAFDVDG